MNRTGWVFAVVALIVGSGVGIGAIAHVASKGEGRGTALAASAALEWIPETATVVGQIDFTRLAESGIAGAWLDAVAARDATESLDELRDRTGIDPSKDVSRVTFSAADRAPRTDADGDEDRRTQRWGVVLDGTFDRDSILQKLAEKSETTSEIHEGITLHLVETRGDDSFAVAFPDASNLFLLGEPTYLRDMISSGLGRSGSVASSSVMAVWDTDGLEGDTFWLVGKPAGPMSALLGGSGSGSGTPELPPLQSFALSGRLQEDLALRARGHASDASAAQQLADVARGFLALGRLNEGVTDELKGLLDTIAIGQVDDEVEVTMTVPHDTLVRFIEERAADRDK